MSIWRQNADSARRRLRSRLTIGAVALALVGGAVAAAETTAATAHKASVVHLTWWTMWSGASLAPVNALVKQFNKTHPDIQVSETNIPSVATSSTA